MRALTVEELGFVSGGESVVVTASRRDELALLGWDQYWKRQENFANMVGLASGDECGLLGDLTGLDLNYLSMQLAVFDAQLFVARQSIKVSGDPKTTVTNTWIKNGYKYVATDNRSNGVGFESLTRSRSGQNETFNATTASWYFNP